MALPTASDNQFPKIILEEVANDGSATVTPAADHRALFLGEDGELHVKDSSGTVTDIGGAGVNMPNLMVGTMNPQLAEDTLSNGGAANDSRLYRFLCTADITVTTAYFRVGTQAGNLDFGIYSEDLATLHASTGSFACPAGGNRSQALASSFAMVGGTVYYLAIAGSNSSVRLQGEAGSANIVATGGWNMNGHAASNFPLTAAPTVTWESHQGLIAIYFK